MLKSLKVKLERYITGPHALPHKVSAYIYIDCLYILIVVISKPYTNINPYQNISFSYPSRNGLQYSIDNFLQDSLMQDCIFNLS